MVILDTCAIIELFKSKPAFSTKTFRQISEGAFILSISFAEIACKVKLGKLEMSISTRDLFRELTQLEDMTIIDIGVTEWLDSIDLVWNDNRDPADRLMTAFAIKNELPIVSTDKKMKAFYKQVIW